MLIVCISERCVKVLHVCVSVHSYYEVFLQYYLVSMIPSFFGLIPSLILVLEFTMESLYKQTQYFLYPSMQHFTHLSKFIASASKIADKKGVTLVNIHFVRYRVNTYQRKTVAILDLTFRGGNLYYSSVWPQYKKNLGGLGVQPSDAVGFL